MLLRPFFFMMSVGSLVAACSSDSSPPSSPDGGGEDGSVSTGGKPSGGSGGSSPGSGGAKPGNGGSGTGGAGTGGAGTGGAGTGGAGTGGAGTGGAVTDSGTGGSTEGGASGGAGNIPDAGPPGPIEHVFVIAMENHDQSQVIGDVADAPYINNTLVKGWASSTNFNDVLDLAIPSEPHYVLVEAGTNAFADVAFTDDSLPSAANSTSSTDHLVTQMKNASPAVTWMAYQQGMDATSGACPIASSGFYMPKHDPFVFFQDVSGSPPSKTNAYCAAHHAPLTQLDADLAADTVAAYNFITPDQCNDMHGQGGCPDSNTIRAGDDFLKSAMKTLVPYVNAHNGVIFVIWDEGSATLKVPFLAIGPAVKKNYVSSVKYTHGSVIKTVENIFGLPALAKVSGDTDFSDLFVGGKLP